MDPRWIAVAAGIVLASAHLLWRTDIVDRISYQLAVYGLITPGGNEDVPGRAAALDAFRRDDPGVMPTALLLIGDSIVRRAPYRGACIVNRGIGGERSDQLLSNLDDWPSTGRVRGVVVSIGTNDVWQRRSEGLGQRVSEILGRIAAPTYLLGLSADLPGIAGANIELRRVCTGKCTFVEPVDALLGDGIHLAPAGYAKLARQLPLRCPVRAG
ncbi:MAG: hypothetical protein M3Q83_00075 [Pseudomonadota bacterium]|nr:hypothetical protein [Pseudomonadota bacterium]